MLGWGIVFCAGIPLILFSISKIRPCAIFAILAKIFVGTGLLIIALFTVILIIELKQDSKISKNYNSKYRYKITKSIYECQNCGNRNVVEEDMYCKVCGIRFSDKAF